MKALQGGVLKLDQEELAGKALYTLAPQYLMPCSTVVQHTGRQEGKVHIIAQQDRLDIRS